MRYNDSLDFNHLRRYADAMNRRATDARVPGTVSAATLRGIILDSGGRCEWCGVSIVDAEFEIDHIVSVRQGGANVRDNLATVCPTCNRQKSDRHPASFAAQIVARTGNRTGLVMRILDHFDTEPLVQRSLFDEPDNPPEDDDEPPPYVWG